MHYCSVCSYNDVREDGTIRVAEPVTVPGPNGTIVTIEDVPVMLLLGSDTERIIDEDFPKNRADSDFFTFYFFIVVYPIAALLTVAHLLLHGIPVLGFILSLAVSILPTVSLHSMNIYNV